MVEAKPDPRVAVGFDLAFLLPAWCLEERGFGNAQELWALADRENDPVHEWSSGSRLRAGGSIRIKHILTQDLHASTVGHVRIEQRGKETWRG